MKSWEKRDAKTLLPLIQDWVSVEAAYLVSDEWKAYSKLRNLNYNHKTVNHSKNFINPKDPIVHTQTIENRWGQIKSLMKKRGRISRISFKKRIKEIAG